MLRKSPLNACNTALLLAFAASTAHAVDVELYGQVNKGLFGYSDGQNTNVTFTDNDFSSTRFGVKGQQGLDNGLTASVLFETEMQSNPSNYFTQGPGGSAPLSNGNSATLGTSTTFNERQARVGLSGDFGGVYLGQQSTAIDGVRTQDLTGVQDVMGADFAKIGGGLFFSDSSGLTNISVNRLAPLYADHREDSIRYDTPILLGLQGRASVSQGGDPELAALYDGGYQAFTVRGALSYQFSSNGANTRGQPRNIHDRTDAALSLGHISGLAGTLAYQTYSVDDSSVRDPQNWYAKLGYGWSDYELAADYGRSQGALGAFGAGATAEATGSLKSYGLGAQYNLGNGVSAAALYRAFDADIASLDTNRIDLYGVTLRVKF